MNINQVHQRNHSILDHQHKCNHNENIDSPIEEDIIKIEEDTTSLLPNHEHQPEIKTSYMINPISQAYKWFRGLQQTFGASFLFLVGTVYWVQGFKSFTGLAVNYLFKDEFSLEPAVSQTLTTTMYIPWGIKPLYGILSDSLPLFGYRRKSYLLSFGIIAFLAYIGLSIKNLSYSPFITTFLLLLTHLSNAFNDVVIDARVVEMARIDPVNGANDLQSLSWTCMALGGVMGSLGAGPATDHLGPRIVFALGAIGPLIIIFLSIYLSEDKQIDRLNCCAMTKKQCHSLHSSLRYPIVFKSILWIFISGASAPAFSQVSFYFSTDVLQFTPEFLGNIEAFGYLFLLVGTWIYNSSYTKVPFRSIFFWAQIMLSIVSLADILLVTRINLKMGISDKAFVVADEIMSDVLGRLKTMPLLVLSAKICPQGLEGTLFALIMSVSNFSYSVASYWGAFWCSVFGISKGNYENLYLAVIIRSIFKLLPIFFLYLIPTDEEAADAHLLGQPVSLPHKKDSSRDDMVVEMEELGANKNQN